MTLFLSFLCLTNILSILFINKASSFEYLSQDHPELGVIQSSKMLLWKWRYLSLKYVGKFFSKPLFTCPTCMCLVHSSYVFWPITLFTYGFRYEFIYIYVIYFMSLGAMCYIASELIGMIEAVSDWLNRN